jgi:hypothetical protein
VFVTVTESWLTETLIECDLNSEMKDNTWWNENQNSREFTAFFDILKDFCGFFINRLLW